MRPILWVVLGAFLASALAEGFGHGGFAALSGATLAWLLWRLRQQQQQIDELRRWLPTGRPAVAPTPPAATEEPWPVPEPTAADVPSQAEPTPSLPAAATSQVAWQERDLPEAATAQLGPSPQPAAQATDATAAPAAPQVGAASTLKRWLFGGNTIVKAGVAILFIGLAFLAKYASERTTLPVEYRLAGVGVVAVLLLAVGWRLRLRRPDYAQALQGGAVAVLYLTLFVAFRYFGVLAAGPVFALMVLVAALAAALAVLQDALALALIGALGGFATPILVSTGGGDPVALFGYYLVLDLGVLAVAWFRTWRWLNLVAFACTFSVAGLWGWDRYSNEHYASAQAFLVAYVVLFSAVLLLPARLVKPGDTSARWVSGSLLFGLPTAAFAMQYGLVRETEFGAALSALGLAGFYTAMALLVRRRATLALVFEGSLAVATVFLTLAIPFALAPGSTAGAWSLEGAALVWLGFAQGRRLGRALGYVLLVLAGGAMAWGQASSVATLSPIWNALTFNALLGAAGSLLAAYTVMRRATDVTLMAGEPIAQPLLIGWATLWVFTATAQWMDAAALARADWPVLGIGLTVLSVLAALYAMLSHSLGWPMVARPAYAHAPLLSGLALLVALFNPNPWGSGGQWAWPMAFGAHLLVLRHGLWAASAWPQRWVHAQGAVALCVVAAHAANGVVSPWVAAGDLGNAWCWLAGMSLPALLVLALSLRPGLMQVWPLRARPEAYRQVAAAQWVVALLVLAGLGNVFSRGDAMPLPYLPLLNPLDLALGLAITAVYVWWRSDAAATLAFRYPRLGKVVAGAGVFLLLNGMLLRAFDHWGGVPYEPDAWIESLAVQTGLTLLWSISAMLQMWWSARRVNRAAWIVGATLLAVVVLKLMLVDLSGSGTVTRIVSFIGVGLLMLVIGYVSPLPPARHTHEG